MKKPAKTTKATIPVQKFPFFCKAQGHKIYDAGACVYPSTKDCKKCTLSNKAPNFGTNPPSPEKSKRISAKIIDKRKQKKTEKLYSYHFEKIKVVFKAYIELLRRFYAGTQTESNLITLKKVETYLEGLQRDWVQKYVAACEAGKKSWVQIAIDGMGPYAFTQKWFIGGLAILLSTGKVKTVSLKPWPEERDETAFFREMGKVEENFIKRNADDAFDKKSRSTYYDTFPRRQKIVVVNWVFGISDQKHHSRLLNYYPPSPNPEALFEYCDKNLTDSSL